MRLLKKAMKRLLESQGYFIYHGKTTRYGYHPFFDLPRLMPADDFRILFDVGANIGQTAIDFEREFPKGTVYCFEPFPETFAELERSTKHLSRTKLFNFGCAASEGTVEVPVRPDTHSQRNSLLSANHKNFETQGGRTTSISLTSIDAFCIRENIGRINLLKTDTEGFDLEVLKGASKMMEKGLIDFVFAECEFDRVISDVHTSFFELHDFMKSKNFRLVTIYTDRADERGFQWGNALFSHQSSLNGRAY